jgi:arylsulfate sulfotransferase
MHHDFQELPDGNLLVAGDSPDLSTVEDYVVEIDRESGEVVWELNAADLIGKEDGQSASIATDGSDEIDWFHNNSLWYDEKNDLVLLSARHKDAIIAIHKSDKSLAWILGDPANWNGVDKKYFFTPTGDDFEWQYAQHQITMLDNGDIMMFDNGTAKVKLSDNDNRVSGDDIYSRAVVYHINTDDMTIEQVFEYGKERGPEWYSDWISGVISLDGTKDQLWITAGANLYDEENNRYDHYPTDMMKQGLIKRTHIDQVSNGTLAYEILISGDTYASLTYRSLPPCRSIPKEPHLM